MTSSVKKERESLKYLPRFVMLYDKAAPIIRYVANLEDLKRGEIPVSPYMLLESNLTLKMILQALQKIPESKDREFLEAQREFDKALSNCIKAAEATEKYVAAGRAEQSQLLLGTIINSTVMAHNYIESVSVKLDSLRSRISELDNDVLPLIMKEDLRPQPETGIHEKQFLNEKAESGRDIGKQEHNRNEKPARQENVIDKIGGCIEYGLDKFGDAVTFPFVAVERLIKIIRKKK